MKKIGVVSVSCVLLLIGCSKPTAEEYFAQAKEAEARARGSADSARGVGAVQGLFVPALELYGKVLSEYPGHGLAEASLFNTATICSNDTHDFERAVEAYKQYASLYPGSGRTPLAMFLVGYLYNNQLHNLDSASIAYKRFLEKYPDHEMAASAQFELNTLGKSPEELLPPPEMTGVPPKGKPFSTSKRL
jgi:TolA-binding protein